MRRLIDRRLNFGNMSTWTDFVYVLDVTDKTPQRVYTAVNIPGKNGALMLDDKRYQNRALEYRCIIAPGDEADARSAFDAFHNRMASQVGYQRFTDTAYPGEYRMAVFRECSQIEYNEPGTMCKFKLTLECKPQRYLTSGSQTTQFTQSGTITNPTFFDAKPLLQVYGTGTVTINDVPITITACNEYTYIDCETMDAYKGAENCNGNIRVPRNFPVLKPGANGISLSGVTKCIVTPRWWRL